MRDSTSMGVKLEGAAGTIALLYIRCCYANNKL